VACDSPAGRIEGGWLVAQSGQVWKRGTKNWCIRWYDAERKRHQRGGFRTKEEADGVLQSELSFVRTGDPKAGQHTLDDLARDFLAQYDKSPSREVVVKWALAKARERFGKTRLDRLNARDLGAWRAELPEAQRHQVFAVLRQVLEQAVKWKMLTHNPARDVKNPTPHRLEVKPFESWAEVEALAAELGEWGPLAIFAVGTGLMPEEWSALQRRDIDLKARVVTVRRTVVDGVVREFQGKTKRRMRRVPLRDRAVEAIRQMPTRIGAQLVFPGTRGGYLNVDNWRSRDWYPALEAAGLERRGPYAMRHTYATFSIAAGIDMFVLARRMGTSVEMIDHHYGHLLPRGEEHERSALDAWDAGAPASDKNSTDGRGMGTDEAIS
jgi:integrase